MSDCFATKAGSLATFAQAVASVPAGATSAMLRDGWIANAANESVEVVLTVRVGGNVATRPITIPAGAAYEFENRYGLNVGDTVEAHLAAEPTTGQPRPTFCANTLGFS